ncbi:MAG: cyclodeaminase/cyclohydrolase family protein [Acidobacteriota bacterium]|nr:cyclodeaminase/cyclohydrolase family protein [Acidobacteriota bacterium]
MSVMLDEPVEQLITLPLGRLLKKFGAGEATPGAGSGAALMGMLACNLCLTVIKLTSRKKKYALVRLQLAAMETRLEALEDKLSDAFQRDSDEWESVVELRRKRDVEVEGSETHKHLSEQAQLLTEQATEVLVEISAACLEVFECALDLLNVGYQAVRGDSSVAACGGLAGAQSALATAYLNLQSFRDEGAATDVRSRCDELLKELRKLQRELESKVTELREEGLSSSAAKPKVEQATREELALAARTGGVKHKKNTPAEVPVAVAKDKTITQSDEEVFSEIFVGKKRGAWFRRIQEFFAVHGLGYFAANKGFLHYVNQAINENGYRSAAKLTNEVLLKWYKTFDARERREGP